MVPHVFPSVPYMCFFSLGPKNIDNGLGATTKLFHYWSSLYRDKLITETMTDVGI